MPPEDVEHRRLDDLLQHGLVVALFPGLHLQLAGAGGDDGGKVRDPWYRLRLAIPQRATHGVRCEVLVVRDGYSDADTRTLVDLRAAARQLRHLGNALLHEVWHYDREVAILERGALLLDDADLVIDIARVVRADLRPEGVLQRRDDAPAVRVVLGIGAGHHVDIDRQTQLESADLHVALLDQVEQADLDPLGKVGELVDREDSAVGARDQSVVDGELIGQVLALGDPNRVDLADQVGDRRVRRGQFLAVALGRSDPADGHPVALGGHAVAAGAADGGVRVVVDLTALDHRDLLVQQRDERPDQTALRLAALTEEDDVLAGEDRVFHLRDDRSFEPDDAGEQLLIGLDLAHQVLAHLLLDGEDAVLALSELGDGRGMLQWKPLRSSGDAASILRGGRAFSRIQIRFVSVRCAWAPNWSPTTGANAGSRAASARSSPKHPASIMSPCGTARCGPSREPLSRPRRGPVTASRSGGDASTPSSSAPWPMSANTWSLESEPVASASR